MKFELLPVVDKMIGLYRKDRNFDRFREYLGILQGDTRGGLAFPVGVYNPMAGEHALQRLLELKALNAELLMQDVLLVLNKELEEQQGKRVFKVAAGLADDLHGGWTERCTTDYQARFRIGALVRRGFCTPVFWSSEVFDGAKIEERTLEYCYRSLYWLSFPKPETLEEHILQEKFVAERAKSSSTGLPEDFDTLDLFYKEHKNSTEHSMILDFLYGDAAVQNLNQKTFGIREEMAGFKYAAAWALGARL